MGLNDTKIRSIQKPDRILKLSDGGGLYLDVNTNGSKLWRMAYRFAGKQKTLSFGAYPDVRLNFPKANIRSTKLFRGGYVDEATALKNLQLLFLKKLLIRPLMKTLIELTAH